MDLMFAAGVVTGFIITVVAIVLGHGMAKEKGRSDEH